MSCPLITQTEVDTCGSVICRSGCRIDDWCHQIILHIIRYTLYQHRSLGRNHACEFLIDSYPSSLIHLIDIVCLHTLCQGIRITGEESRILLAANCYGWLDTDVVSACIYRSDVPGIVVARCDDRTDIISLGCLIAERNRLSLFLLPGTIGRTYLGDEECIVDQLLDAGTLTADICLDGIRSDTGISQFLDKEDGSRVCYHILPDALGDEGATVSRHRYIVNTRTSIVRE